MLKRGSLLLSSHGLAALLSFLRNILLARLLGVEEFGVASTFAILISFIETSTDTGLDKMIVQDRDGNDPRFQGTLHAVQLIRGVFGGVLLWALAGPYARYMGLEELVWAYQLAAIVPVIRGFIHFDIYRLQREFRYGGFVFSTLGAQLGALAVVAGGSLVANDFRLALAALIAFQVLFVLISRLTAKSRFRVAWDPAAVRRSIRFGVPLLANGILMFALLQGDRMIVGGEIGIRELGWFTAAYLLASTPAFVMINTVRSVFLPKLSGNEAPLEPRVVAATYQASCLAALVLFAVVLSIGPTFLVLAYGDEFRASISVLHVMTIAFGMRILVAGSTTVAIAAGSTVIPLKTGLIRFLFLPAAYAAAISGADIVWIATVAAAGEAVAAGAGVFFLARLGSVRFSSAISTIGLTFLALLVALAGRIVWQESSSSGVPMLYELAAVIVLSTASVLTMRDLFQLVWKG